MFTKWDRKLTKSNNFSFVKFPVFIYNLHHKMEVTSFLQKAFYVLFTHCQNEQQSEWLLILVTMEIKVHI